VVHLVKKIFLFCKDIVEEDIIKVFSFTAMSTFVKMLTGLISVKIVASIIGPSGVALVGQLNSFASIMMSLSSGGINSGITKYTAEYRKEKSSIKRLLSSALRVTFTCSLVVGGLMIGFHTFLSRSIMRSSEYSYVFIIFGFTILFYALNMMLISIINGFKEFKKYVLINIINSLFGLIFTLSFVFTLGLKGALISIVTYQSVMLFVTLWMVRKLPWVKPEYFREKINLEILKKYSRYAIMTFATAATVPVSQMLLRGYVISHISPVQAGWWEAMNRISNMYLMVITTSFSVYYLPRLSELTDNIQLSKEIFKAYKVVIPLLLVGFSTVYFLRFFVIRLLFTSQFLPMEHLFIWQLLGDFFKISSWLLAFVMIAKSMTKMFVFTETIFSLLFIVIGFLFMRYNGVVGITQAYLLNYFLYFVCMVLVFRKLILCWKIR
jgi:PST family polysaccharide transporter